MFALSLMLVRATEETIVFCLFGSFPRFVKHKHVIILQLIFAVLWEHGVDSRISSFFLQHRKFECTRAFYQRDSHMCAST